MAGFKGILQKHRGFIAYAVFGILTTLVNWGSYFLCYNILLIPNVPSVIIAWLLAVVFAFITNKIWVFGSKSLERKILLHEIWTFVAARLATGILDVVIMYISVDLLNMNSTVWKLISNLIVIVLNYIFSKLYIFKKQNNGALEKTKDC